MTVIRIKHNRENPFVQLNKGGLWDKDLSTKAVGLWAKCMSMPDNWTFSVLEISSRIKEGRDFVYSTIKELIKFGYCIRVELKNMKNNRFEKYEYHFFEFKMTSEEIKEYVDNLKKSLPLTGFQEAGSPNEKPLTAFPLAENRALLIYKDNNIYNKKTSLSPFQKEEKLFNAMVSRLKELNPKLKEPNKAKWCKEFSLMKTADHRTEEEILQIIDWVYKDDFWRVTVNSPAGLRRNFDKIIIRKNNGKEKAQENIQENTIILKKLEAVLAKRYARDPCKINGLRLNDKFFEDMSRSITIPLNKPKEQVLNILKERYPELINGAQT